MYYQLLFIYFIIALPFTTSKTTNHSDQFDNALAPDAEDNSPRIHWCLDTTILNLLKTTATITTIALFFCGIPICLTIRRHKSTDDISSFPFLMGFLGGASWLIFGILKWEVAMIRVNLVGVAMMAYYLAFYMLYTRSKSLLITQIVMVVVWIISSVAFMILFPNLAFAYYGIPCAIFNIINFGAPLAGLAIVFKRGCCDTLPFPLILASLLVSAQWCAFGLIQGYLEIIIPNGAGMMLSLIQLSLFIVFPRLPGKHSPLGWYIKAIRRMESQRMRKQGHELFGVEYGITSMGKTFDLLAHTLPDPCTSAFPNRRESSKHIRFL